MIIGISSAVFNTTSEQATKKCLRVQTAEASLADFRGEYNFISLEIKFKRLWTKATATLQLGERAHSSPCYGHKITEVLALPISSDLDPDEASMFTGVRRVRSGL